MKTYHILSSNFIQYWYWQNIHLTCSCVGKGVKHLSEVRVLWMEGVYLLINPVVLSKLVPVISNACFPLCNCIEFSCPFSRLSISKCFKYVNWILKVRMYPYCPFDYKCLNVYTKPYGKNNKIQFLKILK